MTFTDIAIVFDCGATNVRVIAIDRQGNVIAAASEANSARPDPYNSAYRIWDTDEIWRKICRASVAVTSQIPVERIAGVTVTTFGVDGTLFDGDGRMLYPVISWQCTRTVPVMQEMKKYMAPDELYRITGIYPFSFNTIFKLIWLRENHPELIERAERYLFLPSIFIYFLSGSTINDTTMAGTSGLTDHTTRGWSRRILDAIDIPCNLLPDPVEPGTVAGTVSEAAAAMTGLPCGIPVVVTGHDTQFALIGSGAGISVPVLSSGTWEILMVRSTDCTAGPQQMASSITTELDSMPGLFDIGDQWIASGLIEWVREKYFSDCGTDVYEIMMNEASLAPEACNGVTVTPDYSRTDLEGMIHGATSRTTRGDVCRATIRALAERLREGKGKIEKAGHFNASSIICVGGGSRNRLWNQMRADAAGVVLRAADISEATAIGAAMFVQYAVGNAPAPVEALPDDLINYVDYHPGKK
jgi:L-fuculokinase